MKIARFLIVLSLICGFAVHSAQAQAYVLKGETFYFGYYDSDQSQVVMTPSGNILVKITFQLDDDDPLVPTEGSYEYPATLNFHFNGWFYLQGVVVVYSDGSANARFKLKG